MEHLQALGWGEWSQPAPNAQQDEIVPGLIQSNQMVIKEAAHQEPIEKVLQAVQQVATPDQAPQGQILAMDDITDCSEDESPPPPPPPSPPPLPLQEEFEAALPPYAAQ
jgi:hypothetical protein